MPDKEADKVGSIGEKQNEGFDEAEGRWKSDRGKPDTIDYFYDDNLCKKCNTRRIDKSENPKSELCLECRQELIKYPIPLQLWLTMAVVAVMVIISMLRFPGVFKTYWAYQDAKQQQQEDCVYTAMNQYNIVLESYPTASSIAVDMTDMAMKYSFYDSASYIIDEYLVGKEVTDSIYNRIEGYFVTLDEYYNTYDTVDAIVADMEESGQVLQTSWLMGELENLLNQPGYDKELLYYYMGWISETEEEQVDYLKKCVEINNNYPDAAAQVANYYRRNNQLTEAKAYLEPILKRFRDSPDLLRSIAILEMLDGNADQGLAYAAYAYEVNPEGEYVADTYAVALSQNGRLDEAKDLLDQNADGEMSAYFDDETLEILEGKISLEDYYIDK